MSLGVLLAVAFVSALVVALIGVPIVRGIAIDRALLDEPGGRKVHATAVPRLGGAAMMVAFFVGLAAAVALGVASASSPSLTGVPVLLIGVLAVSLLGVVDDLRSLPPIVKLAGQTIIAAIVVALGLRIDAIALPSGDVELGLAGAMLTVVWLVAIVNAVNLVDGLDGLAGAVSLAAMVAFGVIGLLVATDAAPMLMAAAAGAVIGFLVYNRPPASIIMGDTGSMFLGFLLAGTGVLLTDAAPHRVSVLAVGLVVAVPIADTLFAIIRRLLAGQSVFAADSRHIHHQLVASGVSPRQVVLMLAAIAAISASLGVLLTR